MSQRSVIRQQLKFRIYIYIEHSVTQACEIFGNLSTIGTSEVNPSLTAYVTCIVHNCIGSRNRMNTFRKLFGYLLKSMFA